MSFAVGVCLLAIVTAIACAVPGTFVVLAKQSMIVDAMSHAVLPGIVVGFLLTGSLTSPWLVVGAALSGLLVVAGSEWLTRSGLVTGDAPVGLIFPALFAVGVLLISSFAADVHLDVHVVLVGDLNAAAWDHVVWRGASWGPAYLYVMSAVAIVNIAMALALRGRLAAALYDPDFAAVSGVRVGALRRGLMFAVAVTLTVAFHAAGAIAVVAFMVVPAATARLVSGSVGCAIGWSITIAVAGASAGFLLAYVSDAPTSATIAGVFGLIFAITWAATSRLRSAARKSASVNPRVGVDINPVG